ncbi:hypothetical protein GmHk_10G028590 [Glycine max]|nr:hypothetical protein GmHk_10G028590 [Glycine max]
MSISHKPFQVFLSHSRWWFQRIDAANANNILKNGLRNLIERSTLDLTSIRHIGSYYFCVLGNMLLFGCVRCTTLSPETKAAAPKWIEVKTHVQLGCYECGYYVMHWMWNIITSEIKSDWSMWFADETPLDIDNITTIRKKWATYFLKTACKKG